MTQLSDYRNVQAKPYAQSAEYRPNLTVNPPQVSVNGGGGNKAPVQNINVTVNAAPGELTDERMMDRFATKLARQIHSAGAWIS